RLSPIARPSAAAPSVGPASRSHPPAITVALLFLTGLTSMAFEVVWIRQFTPYLGTLVYAFAAILGVYLIANFGGSAFYPLPASLRSACVAFGGVLRVFPLRQFGGVGVVPGRGRGWPDRSSGARFRPGLGHRRFSRSRPAANRRSATAVARGHTTRAWHRSVL